MAPMTAVDIFRIFGGVVDEFLPISDILSRLGTSTEVYADPSSAAAVLRSLKEACDDRKEQDADFMPTVRHLIRSSGRPLTTARADEIIVVADALCNYAVGDGMLCRIENGEDLQPMNEPSGGEATAWDEVVVKLRSWVMANPGCTHLELENHLDVLLAAWKADQENNGGPVQHRVRVYDPYPWATPVGLQCMIHGRRYME